VAYKILWIDDNIEELRSHVLYLGQKGYEVDGATNGVDGLAKLKNNIFDAILLDEMMPGMGGLETLEEIRKISQHVPVIMITKSEAEDLMTRAIGKRIDDYLVKPVSPLQILSALKAMAKKPADWESIYQDMTTWGMDLFEFSDRGLLDTFNDQTSAANLAFMKYVHKNYHDWIHTDGATGVGSESEDETAGNIPLLSPRVFETWIEPEIQRSRQVFWIVIDCMRLDQMRMIESLLEPFFHIDRKLYWSMLPTATPYARNALFAGLYPLDIAEGYPQWWAGGADHEGSRNAHEGDLMNELLKRLGSPAAGSSAYYKISDSRSVDHLHKNLGSLGDKRLVAAVYNFLDIMAHGRSQNRILKELAPDEAAFRTLMRTWFEHSTLFEVMKNLSRRDCTVVVTTDHGSMLCKKSCQIRGNRDTSSNVRYKFGDNLGVDDDKVFMMKNPEDYRLPKQSTIENYVVASGNSYLVYPTNFHEYERLYRDSFQHGGISLEEMLCPFAILRPR